jgi:hypothetical protein
MYLRNFQFKLTLKDERRLAILLTVLPTGFDKSLIYQWSNSGNTLSSSAINLFQRSTRENFDVCPDLCRESKISLVQADNLLI